MKFSVIIPTYNDSANLEACLNSIFKSGFKDFEVIVVDDASNDNTREIARQFHCRYVRHLANRGPAAARNTGARYAKGNLLFFIDSNVEIKEDTLEKVSKAYDDPKIMAFQILAAKKSLSKGFGPELLALKWYYMLRDIKEASFVYSHAFSIKKSLFQQIGGFDESFKPPGFGEEFELGYRLRKKCVIHVDPTLVVGHAFQGYWGRTRTLYHRAYNWARVFSKSRKFEKANATFKDALMGIFVLFSLACIPLSYFSLYFLVFSPIFFLINVLLDLGLYMFLKREKGFIFTSKSIFANSLWAVVQVLGGMHFYIKYIMGINAFLKANYLDAIKFRFNKFPSHVVLFVTARCNAECSHCFYWKQIKDASKQRELKLEEMGQVAENLKHVEMLTITGGEPSLRDDIPEIINHFYQKNGLKHVTLHTNGLLPEKIRDIVVKSLKMNLDLEFNLSVSIDGMGEKHDEIRGVTGAFHNAIKTIQLVTREKTRFKTLNITVNSCFSSFNQDGIPSLIDYIYKNHNVDGFYVSLVRGNTKDPFASQVDLKKYLGVVNYLNSMRMHRPRYENYPLSSFRNLIDVIAPLNVIQTLKTHKLVFPCTAGRSVVVITEKGELLPCEMLDESFGSLRENNYDVKKLLLSKGGKQIRKMIEDQKCTCTWECAIMNSIIFNARAYPRLILEWLKIKFRQN